MAENQARRVSLNNEVPPSFRDTRGVSFQRFRALASLTDRPDTRQNTRRSTEKHSVARERAFLNTASVRERVYSDTTSTTVPTDWTVVAVYLFIRPAVNAYTRGSVEIGCPVRSPQTFFRSSSETETRQQRYYDQYGLLVESSPSLRSNAGLILLYLRLLYLTL